MLVETEVSTEAGAAAGTEELLTAQALARPGTDAIESVRSGT